MIVMRMQLVQTHLERTVVIVNLVLLEMVVIAKVIVRNEFNVGRHP